MALYKNSIPITFWKGIDSKTDPVQVAVDRFLELNNSVFGKGGALTKRNGYGIIASDLDASFLTTFNGNLTAIGSELKAYIDASDIFVSKGSIEPLQLDVTPIYRSNNNQTQSDSVMASNGLICTVFTDVGTSSNTLSTTATTYKYMVTDSVTGQNVVAPTLLAGSSGTVEGAPKVFLLGNYFIIVYTVNIAATYHLQYIGVRTNNPTSVTSVTNITSTYTPSTTVAFDGYVANNTLYLAWNGSDGGGAVRMARLSSTLTLSAAKVFATSIATHMSVTADTSGSTPVIYASFYDSSSTDGYTLAVDQSLNTVLAPTKTISSVTVNNITSTAISSVCTIYYEVTNNYSYDSAIRTDFLRYRTITVAGVLGTATTSIRGVGLVSKAFLLDGTAYVLTIYNSAYQPGYFLIKALSGEVAGKIAYQNGSSYYTTGLANVTITDNSAQISYLFKDLIEAVNKSQGVANTAGIYSQTGINVANFAIGDASVMSTAEIGSNLHLSGGFLWAYDGFKAVEHGFFLYPDYVEAAGLADITFTADLASGTNTLLNVSSTTNLIVGMTLTGTDIPASTTITNISGTTVTMSHNAAGTHSTETVTATGRISHQQYYYQATYEWTDNQGNIHRSAPSLPIGVNLASGSIIKLNIPTLRLTYKTSTPVKIVIYRWSTAQPNYYQITSVSVPLMNSTTTDSVSFIDIASDANILGNNLIYTTGGVLENISAPAANVLFLFNDRLWLIDAEDTNQLWYSKQVIQGVPAEMSDLLTYYVAPSIGAQGSTGPTRAAAPMDDKAILFKHNAIYYTNGNGPDNTGANVQYSEPIFVTSTVGCDNQRSIVMTPNGLMFQSNKGIWLLGRDLSTSFIGADVQRYTTGATVLSALTVPGTNQVRFTLDTGFTLMYDYFYGQWGVFNNIPAIASTVYQDLQTYITSSGQVFQETPNEYLDGSKPVLMSFKTSWIKLENNIQGFQRAYYFYLLGMYLSPYTLNCQIAYDYEQGPSQSTQVIPTNTPQDFGDEPVFGADEFFGGQSIVNQNRVFLTRQKCEAFQLTISEVYDSTVGGTAGAGLTLSGLNLLVGSKSKYPRLKASKSSG